MALVDANEAELQEVLKPLGLWRRRSASLKGLAEYAAAKGGAFPRRTRSHAPIPAVGQYVSNAIGLFQHRLRRPLLDVNMARVIERVLRKRGLADLRQDRFLQQAAHYLVRSNVPKKVNWAVLDFAALVCRQRKPLCIECPLLRRCNFGRSNVDRNTSGLLASD